jgi:hypothetical protein
MKRLLAAGVVVGLLGLFGGGATAGADEAAPQTASATGIVRLFENPDFTGTTQSLFYPACSRTFLNTRTIGSFDNQPLAGCEVVLVRFGQTFELCAGRGVVPEPFRTASQVRIQAGSSVPCWIRPAA